MNKNKLYTVIIIHPNDYTYNSIEVCHERFSKDKLTDDIEDLMIDDKIEIVNINPDEEHSLMKCIVNNIKLTKDQLGDTEDCFMDDDNNIYQLCYIQTLNKLDQSLLNGLGCMLLPDRKVIYGTVVFLKSKMTADLTCSMQRAGLDDIVRTLHNNMVHTGVIMRANTNQTIDEYKFIRDPIDWMTQDKINNITLIEKKLLNEVIMFFVEKNPETNIFNKRASLFAEELIYGDCIVAIRNDNCVFRNLSLKLALRLDTLINNDMNVPLTTLEESKTQDTDHGKKIFNFNSVVFDRFKKCDSTKVKNIEYLMSHVSINKQGLKLNN
jgi:hypothetical protein